RSRSWRIALREQLGAIVGDAAGDASRRALEAACERVLDRFPEDEPLTGRGHVGFVEVASHPREIWRSFQLAPRRDLVVHAERACLHPLVDLLERGASSGVVLVSTERIRVLDWTLAEVRPLDEW